MAGSNTYTYEQWMRDDVIDGVKPITMDNIRHRLRAQAIRKLRIKFLGNSLAAKEYLKNLVLKAEKGEKREMPIHAGSEELVLKQSVRFELIDPINNEVCSKFTLWVIPND